jgi:heavy metal sensor kinase
VSRILHGSIRMRLTLLYVSLLAAVLLLYAAVTSAFFLYNLRQQLDLSLDRDIETVEGSITLTPDGRVRLDSRDGEANEIEPQASYWLEIWSGGTVAYRGPQADAPVLSSGPAPGDGSQTYRSVKLAKGPRVRIVSRVHRLENGPMVVRLAVSEEPLWEKFWEMAAILAIGLPVAVIITGVAGFAVAGRALQPLASMARRAEQISAERLNERLTIENPDDERGHLGRVFNTTLARLERSFEQLRRFTADASHELRTPLTAIRSVGEVALQKPGDAAYLRDAIGSMLEEANRLTHLVDNLLTMSRADVGRIALQQGEVAVLDLAKESAALLEVMAEEKDQTVHVEGYTSVRVRGDRLILRQALVNLIDNAVKYSPRHGSIVVRVGAESGYAFVEVQDSGSGIAPEHRSKVFERFYRVDKARSREQPGTGLGLSIAEWAVGAHGGSIELECEPGPGCTFTMRLPILSTTELAKT